VQVGLKDNSDEKSIYQDHYNHFLYELQRSKFGPLPECTLIIAYQAEIGAYFQKETKPLKKQKDRLVFVPTILNNMLHVEGYEKQNPDFSFLCNNCL
jgi:hypothetical protein